MSWTRQTPVILPKKMWTIYNLKRTNLLGWVFVLRRSYMKRPTILLIMKLQALRFLIIFHLHEEECFFHHTGIENVGVFIRDPFQGERIPSSRQLFRFFFRCQFQMGQIKAKHFAFIIRTARIWNPCKQKH
jgi:hypothetical protein